VPLYEYRCAKCGKVIEVLQKFSDPPLKRHKECGGSVKRLVSASSFQLKGGGWYASGYSKESPKADSSGDGSSEGKAESKSDSATESKAETKSESKPESKSESKSDSKPAAKEAKPAAAKTKT
jgi:putative FmdB family regulatory protein